MVSLGCGIDVVIEKQSTFDRLEVFREYYNKIVEKDDDKERFKVILNTLINLYDASKPEIFEKDWHNDRFPALLYLYGLFHSTIDDEKIRRANLRLSQVLDGSVSTSDSFADQVAEDPAQYVIHGTKVIDLSKVDVEELRKEINVAQYKAIEIDDLKDYIEQVLQQMLNKNITRIKFSQRYKNIIDRYNAGGSENEDYYEQLIQLIEELKKENERADAEDLTEEELEILDLLIAGKKLSQVDEQKVKLSAKHLFKKLSDNHKDLLVVDWYKDEQPRHQVLALIQTSLNEDLPMSYDRMSFNDKTHLLFEHFVDMAVQGYGWVA